MIRIFFPLTIFTSSFLLFLVQPMMGKYLLPFFGGSASVWMVAMLFFMTVLLLGYWYAHVLSSLGTRTALTLHASALFLAMFLLWLHSRGWGTPLFESVRNLSAVSTHPTALILFILTESIGVQYFMLASTSSLLQSWYSRVSEDEPFWLYALSNVASLLAIAIYPFFIEPALSLKDQGTLWGVGFGLYGLLMIASLSVFLRYSFLASTKKEVRTAAVRVERTEYLSWLGYSTLGALLLLVCTTYATRSVASIPFLWLLPLALYLLSFALTFTKKSIYRRDFFAWSTAFLLLCLVVTIMLRSYIGVVAELFMLHLALFSSLIFCHGELYTRRPDTSALTAFYLTTSVGGVLAGLLATVFAPLVFSGYWEFYITLYAAMFSASWYLVPNKKVLLRGAFFALVLGVLLMAAVRFSPAKTARNFYGVIVASVKHTPEGETRSLTNGTTIHGMQFLEASKAREPISYYGRPSGIGLVFGHYREWKDTEDDAGIRTGIIGLGAGGLAAYCKSKDSWTFYEINPAVVSFAREHFTFLADCPAALTVAQGDARLLLDRERKSGDPRFDILVLDAFADDAVPMHLLTQEAFGLYLARLSEGGVLAVHISSRYLDLSPVVAANMEHYGMSGVVVSSREQSSSILFSIWVVLSKDKKFIDALSLSAGESAQEFPEKRVVWTDDYSNLFSVLK
ncbi:MAG: fused MFS/spermidine synthase [Parcubacteria group bacterium]|nr:fused MFS/spermidine synthase [Parcubacteria group bacterium]